MRSLKHNLPVTAILFIVFLTGLYLIVTSAGRLWNGYQLDKNGISAPGEITKIEQDLDDDLGTVFYYRVNYSYQGTEHTARTASGEYTQSYALNQPVQVKIAPDNPENAIINSRKEKYSGPVFLFIGGLVHLLFSLFLFFKFQSAR